MKNLEQELKLMLTEREYGLLAERADGQPQLQTNYYFRCGGIASDEMVRIRRKGEVYTLCYKRRLSQQDGVAVCDERECPISAERFGYILKRGVSADEMNKLLDVKVNSPLTLAGSLDTYRSAFMLSNWRIELDKNVYLGVIDYELECENRDVSQLSALRNYLYYTFGITGEASLPKSERFFRALSK